LLVTFLLGAKTEAQVLKREPHIDGGRFDISIVAQDTTTAVQSIDEIVTEITSNREFDFTGSLLLQVSAVNQNAGISCKVDREVFELTQRAIRLSKKNTGRFDISFAAMDRIWKSDDP
jgi:thiamine biosynthesis lipoprotein